MSGEPQLLILIRLPTRHTLTCSPRLAYRASQIVQKPLGDLSYLLGFDIPSHPLIDLAGIKADGAIIHWSFLEKPKHKSQVKIEIHLNGTLIDRSPCHESAVMITGLQPASFYVVRVALLHNEFSSKSAAIRFRTKPTSSDDFFTPAVNPADPDHDPQQELVPRVRPYRALKDFAPSSPTSTSMAREGSLGLGPVRNTSRRPSPASIQIDPRQDSHADDLDLRDGAETVQQLTERLDAIRRETEDAERLAREEDDEEFRQKDELANERDDLKAQVNDKEKVSRNLKREVNTLERQNTAAQNERAKQERLLQQKKQERVKLTEDMLRWERGAEEMAAEVERIKSERATHLEQMARDKEDLREKQAAESAKLRALDDQVKEKTAEVKKIERIIKDNSPNGSEREPNLVQQLQSDAEEERRWQALRQSLQQQYTGTFTRLENAKKFYVNQMQWLETLRADRRRQEDATQYAPAANDRHRMMEMQRRSSPSVSESPRLGTFPVNHSPFSNPAGPVGAAYNPTPFFNIHNGMSFPNPTDEVAMSEDDRDRLTGGAAMSPTAGAALIPADLFSGEGESRLEQVRPLPGLGSLPGLAGIPGPSPQPQHDQLGAGPASPAASSSRSPSVLASPRASQYNLPTTSSDAVIEGDRRSIRSNRSNRAASGGTGSRFSGMFGIRPRNKSALEEGPPLSKASSMPRQDPGSTGLDSTARKRNSSISGLGGLDGTEDVSSDSPGAATARRAFGFFSKEKSGGWPSNFTAFSRKPASPRPGSTHSNELPRPSMESGRWPSDTWSLADGAAGARGSPLAFGAAGWNAPSQQSRMYGSRHPSRRPSVQYAASGPPEDILEDDDSDAIDPNEAPHLEPIGTKPSKNTAADNAAKLNPNAKDFKSFFSSMKFGGKDKARENGEGSDKNDGLTPQQLTAPPTSHGLEHEESPPNSRKSRDTRDTRSMTTTESSLVESGRTSPDLDQTLSYPTSDVPAASASQQSKESLMQKITRKSSSSKFSLPSFNRQRSRLDVPTTSASTPVPAEDDEDPMNESVSSLKDNSPARSDAKDHRGSRSWSSAFKLGKKKGAGGAAEAQSMSDRISMASGTEDGEDDEEGV